MNLQSNWEMNCIYLRIFFSFPLITFNRFGNLLMVEFLRSWFRGSCNSFKSYIFCKLTQRFFAILTSTLFCRRKVWSCLKNSFPLRTFVLFNSNQSSTAAHSCPIFYRMISFLNFISFVSSPIFIVFFSIVEFNG